MESESEGSLASQKTSMVTIAAYAGSVMACRPFLEGSVLAFLQLQNGMLIAHLGSNLETENSLAGRNIQALEARSLVALILGSSC